jgi:hypothetical protein
MSPVELNWTISPSKSGDTQSTLVLLETFHSCPWAWLLCCWRRTFCLLCLHLRCDCPQVFLVQGSVPPCLCSQQRADSLFCRNSHVLPSSLGAEISLAIWDIPGKDSMPLTGGWICRKGQSPWHPGLVPVRPTRAVAQVPSLLPLVGRLQEPCCLCLLRGLS